MAFWNGVRQFFSHALGIAPSHNEDTYLLDRMNEYNHRRTRYRVNWAIYRGHREASQLNEDETRPTTVNYLKKNIDKVNYFAFGQGVQIINPRYQDILETAIEQWGPNPEEKFLRMAQFGSVTGDAYVMVAPVEMAEAITKFNPESATVETDLSTAIRIVVLNSAYCTPIYSDFDMDELVGMHLRIPVRRFNTNGTWDTKYQNFYIDKQEIRTWETDVGGNTVSAEETTPNAIGEVYVVHIRNFVNGDSLFGQDDIQIAEKLNEEITDSTTNIGQIIKYHADPVTLIFGAKSGSLQKGPNKIWGNLPKDGDVKNLELQSDLEASNKYRETVTTDLHALMGVPEIAQGTKQAISNTSGVALHTMYLPLIEQSEIKHLMYSPGIVRVLVLTLRWMYHLKKMYLRDDEGNRAPIDGRSNKSKMTEDDYADIQLTTELVWNSPLPKDRLVEAQIEIAKLQAGLQDIPSALKNLGEQNIEQKVKKIEEDAKRRAKIALETSPPPVEGNNRTGVPTSGQESGNGQNTSESEEPRGRPRTEG